MHPVVGNPFIKREGANLPSEGPRIKVPRLHHFATGGGHTTIALRHRVPLRYVYPKCATRRFQIGINPERFRCALCVAPHLHYIK
jgi:hypothetical protein